MRLVIDPKSEFCPKKLQKCELAFDNVSIIRLLLLLDPGLSFEEDSTSAWPAPISQEPDPGYACVHVCDCLLVPL